MIHLITLSLLACASTVAARPAASTTYQIRSVSDPIYHLYLQSLPTNGETFLPKVLLDF